MPILNPNKIQNQADYVTFRQYYIVVSEKDLIFADVKIIHLNYFIIW